MSPAVEVYSGTRSRGSFFVSLSIWFLMRPPSRRVFGVCVRRGQAGSTL